jgi:hypothetical protein
MDTGPRRRRRCQLVGQVDHVALGLAHRGAVQDHLALGGQRAERLVEVDHAQVVQDLGEEAARTAGADTACSLPPT